MLDLASLPFWTVGVLWESPCLLLAVALDSCVVISLGLKI